MQMMKGFTNLIFKWTLWLLCSSLGMAITATKQFTISQVNIEAQLQADGSMLVSETRTYVFRGNFHYAYRTIPIVGDESYSDFAVLENGQFYTEANTEEPHTFRVSKSDQKLEIRWFYHARNETRTFEIRYRVGNLVQRHQDAAVLYFKFIGRDWNVPNNDVKVRVHPPQPLDKSLVQHWAHGPLWAHSTIENDGIVLLQCTQVPKHSYLELRALYPPEIFGLSPQLPSTIRHQIEEEETIWAETANRERMRLQEEERQRNERYKWGVPLALILSLCGLINWWTIYKRHRRRPYGQPPIMRLNSEIPDRTPPALVRYLLNMRMVDGASIVATLLDLAHRGFISIQEERKEHKGLFGGRRWKTDFILKLNRTHVDAHQNELLPFETELLQFIFQKLAAGQEQISMKEISKHPNTMRKFFLRWQKSVKKEAEAKNYYDKNSIKGMNYSLVMSVVGLVLTVAGAVLFGPWLLAAAAVMLLILFLSLLIIRRTDEGERQYHGWKALSRYLKKYHFNNMERGALLSQINRYFVYGPAIGLQNKHYRQLAAHLPPGQEAQFFPWFVQHAGGSSASPTSFAASISSMISTMSSSAGMGGGASGGGGGGAGGGGGGAG